MDAETFANDAAALRSAPAETPSPAASSDVSEKVRDALIEAARGERSEARLLPLAISSLGLWVLWWAHRSGQADLQIDVASFRRAIILHGNTGYIRRWRPLSPCGCVPT